MVNFAVAVAVDVVAVAVAVAVVVLVVNSAENFDKELDIASDLQQVCGYERGRLYCRYPIVDDLNVELKEMFEHDVERHLLELP